jgi:hypothetical protein
MGAGVAIYMTEIWRDWTGRELSGRGSFLHGVPLGGFIDGPQIAAVFLVLAGALTLRERNNVLHEHKGVPGRDACVDAQPPPASENRGAA